MAVVVVIAILCILVFLLCKRKRDKPDSVGACEEPAQQAQPPSDRQTSRELPPTLDVEDIYEQPAQLTT